MTEASETSNSYALNITAAMSAGMRLQRPGRRECGTFDEDAQALREISAVTRTTAARAKAELETRECVLPRYLECCTGGRTPSTDNATFASTGYAVS